MHNLPNLFTLSQLCLIMALSSISVHRPGAGAADAYPARSIPAALALAGRCSIARGDRWSGDPRLQPAWRDALSRARHGPGAGRNGLDARRLDRGERPYLGVFGAAG